MKFVYPAVFKWKDGTYWVRFPDLEGCFSQGDTLEKALINAQEALELYLEPDNDDPDFPCSSQYKDIKADNNECVLLVSADVRVDMKKSVKKTLTIPAWLNRRAEEKGINFSQTLQEALKEKLGF